MDIETSIKQANAIQEMYPDKLLCGNLALTLYGYLDRTEVHDIDFASDNYTKYFNIFETGDINDTTKNCYSMIVDKDGR